MTADSLPKAEIQNSARSLFRAYVAEESDSNIVTLVERWSSNCESYDSDSEILS